MEEINYADRVARALEGASQKDRLQAAAWIVHEVMHDTQPGMTEADHRLDVLSRIVGDVAGFSRGFLARYGLGSMPSK